VNGFQIDQVQQAPSQKTDFKGLTEDYQKEVANYLWELNPEKRMMASFFQES
jgi:hypothetical protein